MPREPALAASAGRRCRKRSWQGVSGGHDGRSERPATGHGQPRTSPRRVEHSIETANTGCFRQVGRPVLHHRFSTPAAAGEGPVDRGRRAMVAADEKPLSELRCCRAFAAGGGRLVRQGVGHGHGLQMLPATRPVPKPATCLTTNRLRKVRLTSWPVLPD